MVGQRDEASSELLMTIQREHVPTKTWYNESPGAQVLREKYGSSYPSMWREVVGWEGWRETRKLYLKAMDAPAAGTDGNGNGGATKEEAGLPRKRRSRWASTPATTTTNTTANAEPKRRKSRWARGRDETPQPMAPPQMGGGTTVLDLLPGLPTNLNPDQMKELADLQKKLREANEKLVDLEVKAAKVDALPVGHADRSPSPPPVYGADGKRRNTRAIRWRERYTSQRQDTLESILSLTTLSSHQNPNAVAPSLFRRKRTRKIPIPIEKHPTYNFIGLIIGPRGKTQKEMENKTGCKIAIRGKGSVKEGARGRRDGKMMDGDDEPLHVVVTGDNQGSVDAAADMVQQMLVVIDDDKNVHKQQQLRELALLNGTLKEEEFCQLCAEKGHRAFECPKRFANNNKFVSVKCAICGDTSHPTRDCIQKPKDGICPVVPGQELDGAVAKDEKQMDKDYLDFMNEVDGKAATAAPTAPEAFSNPAVVTLKSGTPVLPDRTPGFGTNGTDATTNPAVSSVITTISSRVVSKAELEARAAAEQLLPPPTPSSSATTEVTSAVPPPIDGGGGGPPHTLPPPTLAAPMAGTGIPPPPTSILPPQPTAAATTFPPVSILPPPHRAPTSHSQHPPPPPTTNTTQSYLPPTQQPYPLQPPPAYNAGGYPQQAVGGYLPPPQHVGGYDGGYGAQQSPPMQPPPQQQQPPPSQQQQQGGWDYRSYYGSAGGNDTSGGAGGFNWWEA